MRIYRAVFLMALSLSLVTSACATLPPDSTPTPLARLAAAPPATLTLLPAPTLISARTAPPTTTSTRTQTPAPSPTPRCTANAPVNLASARSGRIDTKFRSNLIGRDLPILIYLPPGYYDSQRCYPVLYMLHGYGGPYTEWDKWGMLKSAEQLIRTGQIQPMIIVLPEGERSWWFNHYPVVTPNNDGKPWGDYVWKEVVGYVDANYRTLTKRESRAVGGLSSGGQGALMLGLTHPEIFAIIGAHAPSLREADGSLEFFGPQDYFNQYDPIWLVKNKDTWKQLTIEIDIGQEDDLWGFEVRRFDETLNTLKIPHQFNIWTGRHEGLGYWAPHSPDFLMYYSSQLEGAVE